ncbi:regulator of cell morphogenesis and NO signaling [Paenibacillus sp. DS2015]|uniref:iron-sulfur cluster repair di-iron protein n=1 Tax=Paenibacillus sp. DS2015 TaxID=3373917 RepID=UPI003D1A9006
MSTLIFDKEDKVSEIVIKFPKASDYFRDHKIDFCCGGNRPLQEALEERGLELKRVLDELHHLAANHAGLEDNQGGKNVYVQMDSSTLIQYIVSKHHDYLREELPEIQKNVTRVNRVHGHHDLHLVEVEALYTVLKNELLEHTTKEEVEIFPQMLIWDETQNTSSDNKLREAISGLESEHDEAGNILKKLREITNDFTPPVNACTTYRLTYERLAELERMTYEHVHLENNILFPRYPQA